MSFQAISEFIEHLAKKQEKLTLKAFSDEIRTRFMPNLDITFQNYFIELISHEDEFCIDSRKLVEYGVAVSDDSKEMRRRLTNLKYVLDVDFIAIKEGKKKVYMLKPDIFKKILMRAQRIPNQTTDPEVFADYYLFLEKVTSYYNTYQLLQLRGELHHVTKDRDEKSDIISDMFKTLNDIKTQNSQILEKNDELLFKADIAESDNEQIRDKLTTVVGCLRTTMKHLNIKSHHSTIDPTDQNKVTSFGILHPKVFKTNPEQVNTFYLIRGQQVQIKRAAERYEQTHVYKSEPMYNANAINLMINSKERFEFVCNDYIDKFNIPIVEYNNELIAGIEKSNDEIMKRNNERGLPTTPEEMQTFNSLFTRFKTNNFKSVPTSFASYNKFISEYNDIIDRYEDDDDYQKCEPIKNIKDVKLKNLLTRADIPITVGSTKMSYSTNDHFTVNKVLGIIFEMDFDTKLNPVADDPEINNVLAQ